MKAETAVRTRKALAVIRARLTSEQAFSIGELIIAIMLLFVITFAALNFSEEGTSLAKASVSSANINQDLRESLETMTRQIRVAYYFEKATASTATVPEIGFVSYARGNNDRYSVAFRLFEGVLETSNLEIDAGVSTIPTRVWEPMTGGVTSLAFTYYDASGHELTAPAAGTTTIARVDIAMSITSGFTMTIGTSSEGHYLEKEAKTVSTSGSESVAFRNILTDTP
jgi:hypothetical protein